MLISKTFGKKFDTIFLKNNIKIIKIYKILYYEKLMAHSHIYNNQKHKIIFMLVEEEKKRVMPTYFIVRLVIIIKKIE